MTEQRDGNEETQGRGMDGPGTVVEGGGISRRKLLKLTAYSVPAMSLMNVAAASRALASSHAGCVPGVPPGFSGPVFDGGGPGSSPWGLSLFPDPSARWIWNTATPNLSAPIGWASFGRRICVDSETAATVYLTVDNAYKLYIDGSPILSDTWWPSVESAGIVLSPGQHDVIVAGRNDGGPAGVLLTILDGSGGVIVHTDTSWGSMTGGWIS